MLSYLFFCVPVPDRLGDKRGLRRARGLQRIVVFLEGFNLKFGGIIRFRSLLNLAKMGVFEENLKICSI